MSECRVTFQYTSDLAKELSVMPRYATDGSAGCDLCACIEAPILLKKGERLLIPTGIAIALPSASFVALVFARSGLSVKNGIAMANGVGVIDSDYRGEVKCPLINLGQEDFWIEPGARIAQMAIMPVSSATFVCADTLDTTQRGTGGFGSTGIK